VCQLCPLRQVVNRPYMLFHDLTTEGRNLDFSPMVYSILEAYNASSLIRLVEEQEKIEQYGDEFSYKGNRAYHQKDMG
jgi:hypothetical protein